MNPGWKKGIIKLLFIALSLLDCDSILICVSSNFTFDLSRWKEMMFEVLEEVSGKEWEVWFMFLKEISGRRAAWLPICQVSSGALFNIAWYYGLFWYYSFLFIF